MDGNLPESLGAAFSFDGKQYALPSQAFSWVTFSTQKDLADSGLTAASTTWAEFTAACDTLKAAGVATMASTRVGRWPSFILFEELVLRTEPQFHLTGIAFQAAKTLSG